MNKLFPVFLTFLLLITLVPMSQASQISIHIEGPTVIGTNQTVQYKVYTEGFFNEYKCGIILVGYNLTGADPLNLYVKSSKDGHFTFSVTAPNTPQTIYIHFKAYGMENETKILAYEERVLEVQVKKAMDIKVKIKNVENYEIKNVVLSFYLDGRYIGNTTVEKIGANSTKNVVYKWIPEGIYSGEHVLTVKISSQGIVFENGKRVYEYKFYYDTSPPSYEYITYLSWGLLILVSALFTLYYFGRRGRKRGPSPKWKK